MKKRFFLILAITLIIFLGVGLRFFKLGQVPIELNRDEASLGYTAYSISQNGYDEHGVVWPINIQSFGDWKLPAYVYTLIPFVKILGLENWVVRLPSALAGVGVVILAGVNTWILTASWFNRRRRYLLSLLVSLMIAISPWSIHLSHLAYEANLAMFFFLLGFFLLQLGLKKTETKEKSAMEKDKNTSWHKGSNLTGFQLLQSSCFPRVISALFIPLSIFFFGLTLFTYHAYQIFTPLMAVGLLVIYKTHLVSIIKHHQKTFFAGLILAGFFSISLIFTSVAADQTKFSGLSIFDKTAYGEIIEVNRGFFNNRNGILAKFHTNSPVLIINQIQRNLAAIFSAKFLFFEGGTHGSHDIPGTGKLYPIAFIFLIVSALKFFQDFREKKLQKWQKIIFLWLIISIIAPAITFEAAHTIRFSPALFALEFLSAYGFFLISIHLWQTKLGKIILTIIILVLIYSTLNFLLTYFVVAPKRDINYQNWQIQKLVSLIKAKKNQYDTIIMPGTQWSPYIYFLYYLKYDPALLAKNLEFYPTDHEGFRHVKRLENIYFEKPNWHSNEKAGKNILYVVKRKEIPIDKLESGAYSLEYSLTNPYAKYEWILLAHE